MPELKQGTDPMSSTSENLRPSFYTVAETARLLRVDPTTIYRAIREDAFPAVLLSDALNDDLSVV